MKTDLQITNFALYDEIVASLEVSLSKVREVFESQHKNRASINQTESWTGKAQGALSQKYDLLADNFDPILYSIELYIKFLKKTSEDYKMAEKAIIKNMEEMASNLDVNS